MVLWTIFAFVDDTSTQIALVMFSQVVARSQLSVLVVLIPQHPILLQSSRRCCNWIVLFSSSIRRATSEPTQPIVTEGVTAHDSIVADPQCPITRSLEAGSLQPIPGGFFRASHEVLPRAPRRRSAQTPTHV